MAGVTVVLVPIAMSRGDVAPAPQRWSALVESSPRPHDEPAPLDLEALLPAQPSVPEAEVAVPVAPEQASPVLVEFDPDRAARLAPRITSNREAVSPETQRARTQRSAAQSVQPLKVPPTNPAPALAPAPATVPGTVTVPPTIPPPTSEAPPPTSEAPPPTTSEAPPPTSEAPPPTTSEAPPPTSEAPPPTSEAPPPTTSVAPSSTYVPPPTSEAPSSTSVAPSSSAAGETTTSGP
jgi:hypothetical protein